MATYGQTFSPSVVGWPNKGAYKTLEGLLGWKEDEIDFIHSKLFIDSLIDPSSSIRRETKRLNDMVEDIKQRWNPKTNLAKKEALRRYLYEAGEWNNHQPFHYDFDDPLGTKLENKVIKNYLDNKKGNCVSMPILFVLLGQKLGIDVTLSNAPLHVFVKFRESEESKAINLETTSGANPARDVWYRQQFPITDEAIESGIYLNHLTKKETVTVMATTLLEHYMREEDYATVIALSHLLLTHNNSHISAFIHLSSAHNELLKKHDLWNYHTIDEVPENKKGIFKYLVPRINWYHREAEKRGWKQLTQAQNDQYLDNVKKDAVKFTEKHK